MKIRFLVILLVVTVMALSLGVAVASHMSVQQAAETCAPHGLGPNFAYAEGPDSALALCVNGYINH